MGTNNSLEKGTDLHTRRSVLLCNHWQRTKYKTPLIKFRRLIKYPAKAHSNASTFAGRPSTTQTYANIHVPSRIRTRYISVRTVQAWYTFWVARSLWSAKIWQPDKALQELPMFLFLYIWEVTDSNNTPSEVFRHFSLTIPWSLSAEAKTASWASLTNS